jgi:hypothetical protein
VADLGAALLAVRNHSAGQGESLGA